MTFMDRGGIDALLQFYETLTPDRIPDFSLYAENTYLKYTTRIEDIREFFARMFAKPPLIGGAVRYLRRVMG